MNTFSSVQRTVWMLAFILAPLLMIISQFFWVNQIVRVGGGVLQQYSCFCFIFVFQALFAQLNEKMPRYAVIGFCVAVLGCIGGNNFGMDGIYSTAMGINNLSKAGELHQRIGGLTVLYLYIPGLLFPLSLLILGIQLMRTNILPLSIGLLLCAGAICFPLSRIPRIEWLAHVDNALLFLALLLCMPVVFSKRIQSDRQVPVSM